MFKFILRISDNNISIACWPYIPHGLHSRLDIDIRYSQIVCNTLDLTKKYDVILYMIVINITIMTEV